MEPRLLFTVNVLSGSTASVTLLSNQQLRLVSYNNQTLATLTPGFCNAQFDIAGSTITSTSHKGNTDFVYGANFSVNGIDLTNTDVLSRFTITDGRGVTLPVQGITTDGSINTVRLTGTTFSGTFSTMGARSLTFGDIAGGSFGIGSGLGSTSFRAGTIDHSMFNFDSPITQFQTGPIVSSLGPSSITAPSINNLRVNGNADFDLSLGTSLHYGLGAAYISGSVQGGSWSTGGPVNSIRADSFQSSWRASITGRLGYLSSKGDFAGFLSTPVLGTGQFGSATNATFMFTQPFATNSFNVSNFNVTGAFSSSTLWSDGNLGFLRFGSLNNGTIFSGVTSNAPTDALPANDQLTAPTFIRGAYVTGFYQNSFLAAGSFGKADLGQVLPQPTGNPFGVTTSKLGSLQFDLGVKHISAFNVDRLLDIQNAEQRRGITAQDLGNFQFNIAPPPPPP